MEQDQFEILANKIVERKFHLHRSNRNFLLKRLIEGIRRLLIKEIELILDPVLDRQKEINLRFLKEIKSIKEQIDSKKNLTLNHEKKDK